MPTKPPPTPHPPPATSLTATTANAKTPPWTSSPASPSTANASGSNNQTASIPTPTRSSNRSASSFATGPTPARTQAFQHRNSKYRSSMSRSGAPMAQLSGQLLLLIRLRSSSKQIKTRFNSTKEQLPKKCCSSQSQVWPWPLHALSIARIRGMTWPKTSKCTIKSTPRSPPISTSSSQETDDDSHFLNNKTLISAKIAPS